MEEIVKANSTWIRIAGNAKRIRTPGDAMHWRCYIGQKNPEVPLLSVQIVGESTPTNFVLGTDPSAQNELGLVAWFDVFGDIVVEDDIAHITLRPL